MPHGSCECLLRGPQLVHAQCVELRDGWTTRAAPIWSITWIAIDVIPSIPVGLVESCKIQPREIFRCCTLGGFDKVDPPLPSRPTFQARVEKVLIEHNQIAGLAKPERREKFA